MTRLSIADLEIEQPHEPLEIETPDGTVFQFQDPKSIDLDKLVALESLGVSDQVRALVADGRFEEFAASPGVDGYFFSAVMKAYAAHFGVGSLGEGLASPRSSTGSARPSRPISPSEGSSSERSSVGAASG